jgi:hypothetical protein
MAALPVIVAPRTESGTPLSPRDWRFQARHAVTTVEALERALVLTDDEREGARRA